MHVIDAHTVEFSVAPHAEYLDSWRATAIMPAHLLGDVPPAELRQHPFGSRCPVGNGPFVSRGHQADASWSFRRNPAFPEGLGGPPYLERYVYRIIPEQTTLLTELLTESIDFYPSPGPDQAPQIEDAPHLGLRVFPFRATTSSRGIRAATAHGRPGAPGDHARIDRAEILQAIRGGYGTVANAGVPPFHWAYLGRPPTRSATTPSGPPRSSNRPVE